MRQLIQCLSLLALAMACVASQESVADLKAHLEKVRPEERVQICLHIAQLQLKAADKLYTDGHVDDARAAVDDVATYFEKARDVAVENKSHLKNVEIGARKSSEKLADIKRTLAFEDQAPVEQAIRRIETVRTTLLQAMFADKKKEKK